MLTKNPLLEELCARFAQEQFDWQKVIEWFKATELYPIGGYHENTLANELARVHLYQFLIRSISNDRAHLQREFIQNSFSPHYEFYRKHGVLTIHERGRQDEEYGTLDEVVRVDGLPVLWTLKLSTSARRSSGKTKLGRQLENERILPPRERPFGLGYNQILREENGKQIIAPILDYYSQEKKEGKESISSGNPVGSCGYAVVLYPDVISPKSTIQQQFREQNGIIVPWTMPSKEYREKVAAIAVQHQLLPKRQKNVQNGVQQPRRERRWV